MKTARRKVTRFLLPLLAAVLLPLVPAGLSAEKKDVTDPVMREIINTFSARMPKFIDKHGQNIFVADGAVTRGTLMQALYEYDKTLKIGKRDFVSRAEYEELQNRLTLLEKSARGGSSAQSIDMTQLINDLVPNMPYILDNSLSNSKVFQGLKQSVAANSGASRSVPEGDFVARDEFSQLSNKLSLVERNIASLSMGGTRGGSEDPALRGIIVKTQQEVADLRRKVESSDDRQDSSSRIAKLERRISSLESGRGAGGAAEYADAGGSSSSLTKISLGLSMVAAFFIAR
ncbi:MAG TPA: hypothetical protein DEE98_04330 [Elusimicrobia bacterium]|nr:MAG: hypothetical protein A2278_08920 [Elusimicrobia bacterium RIFOXYA12_FULL_49_49]OGS11849.1 MAG: hypothetical protein A2386_07280 [Elusimicrobia bacterium RIFOXYB1_FULL_48_9]OGS14752.1 MAG: hypothetical protein A2251_09675 [Elusimicrobia bacterium RIFOXYA2_FULL_47_53]OGS25597.1 MAG: hypothetical protein A2339_05920 [Elusimicrobia bacterium RIFOXYB12_FULL_50_12]OGS28964.1 MAG: hypothetical protein A2323_05350 [Elusimicrobia bacterium RIFOXYB2_FULL_46_23]HBU69593.1 hypothetical protein [El